MVRKRLGLHTFWNVVHRDVDGTVLYEESGHNILFNLGEQYVLKAFTGQTAIAANLYLGIDDHTLAEADTMAELTNEPVGDGYARIAVAKDTEWTVQLDGGTGDYEALTDVVQFAASGGDWAEMDNVFLCTDASGAGGTLISSFVMSTPRTVTDGQTLDVSLAMRLREYTP